MKKTRNGMRITGLLLTMVMLVALLGAFSMTASAAAAEDISVTIDTGSSITLKDTDGDGAYEIGNADELYAFAAAVNGGNTAINGELTANIVVNKNVLKADGTLNGDGSNFRVWTPIGNISNNYIGAFDGGNYTVSGLYFNNNAQKYVGLFGYVGTSGKAQNVGITDSHISGKDSVGGVVGYCYYGTVTNCYNMGTVSGTENVGGVVGNNCSGIMNCYNTGTVSGTNYVGGVVGYNSTNGNVTDCRNTGTVTGESWIGGVVGMNRTSGVSSTVVKCYNTGAISATKSTAYIGGVVGHNNSNCVVTDCYNTGKVTYVQNGSTGGVVGYNDSSVTNCYNKGTISGGGGTRVGGVVGFNNVSSTSDGKATNCYYLDTCGASGDGKSKTAEQFRTGEIALLLQGEQTEEIWGQTIGTDAFPTLGGKTVYYGYLCGDSEKRFTNNVKASETPIDHSYENGFCTICDAYESATLNEDGYYEISNGGQLFWFANYINTVDRTANAKLTANIDLENRPWTPIGSTGEESNNFRGHFDGQGYTIKGLYVEGGRAGLGFFGEVRIGTVENFTIYGEVKLIGKYDYVGGVIGSAPGANSDAPDHNGATIRNITSYVNVTLGEGSHGSNRVGGFVGYANHETLIENCTWYGTLDLGPYRAQDGVGGLVGKANDNSAVTIRNCAAYGRIKTSYQSGSYNDFDSIFIGGILSNSVSSASTVIENTVWAGMIINETNLGAKAHLSSFGTMNGFASITNCYVLNNTPYVTTNGAHDSYITVITEAQLASGEIAYLLGSAWGQEIGKDVYPVLGGTPVGETFKMYGQQLNVGGDLSMKYYVTAFGEGVGTDTLKMKFIFLGRETVVSGIYNAEMGMYVFTLEGINPQCMGDKIDAYLLLGDEEKASKLSYTVEENLLALRKEYEEDEALVTLVNDILAYGTAASEYKDHNSMTDVYVGSDREIRETEWPALDNGFEGYTVVFGQVNYLKIKVNLAEGQTLYLDGVNVTAKVVDGIFKTDGIAPTNFDKKFNFEIRTDGVLFNAFSVSVNDYLSAKRESETMGKLVKALYNYGVSAKEYAIPSLDLSQYESGSVVDITEDVMILGDGNEYNVSLNIAENVTVTFDAGTSGVKLTAPITVADGKTLTLIIAGDAEHTVNGGISLGNASNVIIEGDLDKPNNKLTVTGTNGNAGIGANNGVTAGDITIRNARVDATGGGSSDGSGAAIGTSDASMGNILIENSIVTAAGGYYNSDDFMEISHAAAIGMGYYGGTMGNITLKDSEITASNNGDGLASVIGAGSQNKEGDNKAGTLGDIIITNTDLNLSMVIGTEICYAAVIGPGMGYSFAWTNMGKIIFTDMTQEQLDEIIPTWLPSDFNEWGAYALGRGYDGSAYKKETFGGVWVSDGNGDTVQIGNEDGYYCINDKIN